MKALTIMASLLLLTACDTSPAGEEPISGSWQGVIYDSETFQNSIKMTVYDGGIGDSESIIGGHELLRKADGRIYYQTLRGTLVGEAEFFDLHLLVGIDQNNSWVYTGYIDETGNLCLSRDLLPEIRCLTPQN